MANLLWLQGGACSGNTMSFLNAEAVRGALCHWIEVKGGKIKNYQIIAPTTWNVGPRTTDGTRGPMEQALIGTPIADPTDPVEVGHVCRSYDSCLVCTVHGYDAKTGEQLAKFALPSGR
jgi:uptake hydrogenase large subunit